MANGSLSTSTKAEFAIRRGIIEDDLVDCIVALPGQLFYTIQIPACLWFVTRNEKADPKRGLRDRSGETLFIDARKMGRMVDRTHREPTVEEIQKIADTYHAWRGEPAGAGLVPALNGATTRVASTEYRGIPGFCKSATLEEIRKHGYVLTPGRYVGAEKQEDDGEPFEEKMARLVAQLKEQQAEAARLDAGIAKNLEELWGMGSEWREGALAEGCYFHKRLFR
jgi:type I restriction enzyme M protein